jgi:hypothetical protein
MTKDPQSNSSDNGNPSFADTVATNSSMYLQALSTSFERHARHAAASAELMSKGKYTAATWYEDQVLIMSRIYQDTSACLNALVGRPPVQQ